MIFDQLNECGDLALIHRAALAEFPTSAVK